MEHKNYDVIVAGGGTAGISAALSAARYGAHVLLVEKNSYVGGTAASGLPFLDFFNRDGKRIIAGQAEELVGRLYKEKAALGHVRTSGGHLNSVTMIDPEWVKIVAEELKITYEELLKKLNDIQKTIIEYGIVKKCKNGTIIKSGIY